MMSCLYLKQTESTRNCDLYSNYGSLGTQTKNNKIHKFFVNSEKLCYMFSGKKVKEHMESELSSIFPLKVVAKKGAWE